MGDEETKDHPGAEIDTSNRFAVGAGGAKGIFIQRDVRSLTADDALNLAAWLALIADPGGQKFKAIIKAIQES